MQHSADRPRRFSLVTSPRKPAGTSNRACTSLFKGAVQGIRNPDAHEQFKPLDEEEGLEDLAFASMLMRRLDGAKV
jgi:hypothetical protein